MPARSSSSRLASLAAGTDFAAWTRAIAGASGRRGAALYSPLRAALTGRTHGPELAPLVELMGPELVAARLRAPRAAPHPLIQPLVRGMLHIHNSLTGRKEAVQADRARRGPHVRVRHHRVRLLPHRTRPHADRVRRRAPAPALDPATTSRSSATSPTSTTRSSSARSENGEPIAALDRSASSARYEEDCARARRAARRPRAAGRPSTFRRSIEMVRAADRARERVRGRERRRLLLGRELRALRQALGQDARRSARRRARRDRREQARSARLRAVEGGEARRARRGNRPGARAGPAGTSSARRCRWRCSARISTSTAAAWTSSSRITRTRSRRPARPAVRSSCNVWMHNGFVRVDDEKMSKSLGNFFTVREVLDDGPRSRRSSGISC